MVKHGLHIIPVNLTLKKNEKSWAANVHIFYTWRRHREDWKMDRGMAKKRIDGMKWEKEEKASIALMDNAV